MIATHIFIIHTVIDLVVMDYIDASLKGNRGLSKALLIAYWCAGILLAYTAVRCVDTSVVELLLHSYDTQFSALSIAFRIFISLFLSLLAIYLARPELFLLAAFIKAFCVSYYVTATGIASMQGDCMLYFPPSALLLVFWLHNLPCISMDALRDLGICAVLLTIIFMLSLHVML